MNERARFAMSESSRDDQFFHYKQSWDLDKTRQHLVWQVLGPQEKKNSKKELPKKTHDDII